MRRKGVADKSAAARKRKERLREEALARFKDPPEAFENFKTLASLLADPARKKPT